MKYKYKAIYLNTSGNNLEEDEIDTLNEYFEKGWEYVDTIQQNGYAYSPVGVILRKIIEGGELLP